MFPESIARAFSDPLSAIWIAGDADLKMLQLFVAGSKSDFKIELICTREILRSAVKRNEDRHFGGETLLEIGCLECPALDGDGAVRGRFGKLYRWQWAGRAVGPNAGEDTDPNIATRHSLDRTRYRIFLRANAGRQQKDQQNYKEPEAHHHRQHSLAI